MVLDVSEMTAPAILNGFPVVEICPARLGGLIVVVDRGASSHDRFVVARWVAQSEAMFVGSAFGWDAPLAHPEAHQVPW